MDIKAIIERARASYAQTMHFLQHDVWHVGKPGETIPSGFAIKQLRVGILLFKGIMEETLLLRASALTFTTLLFIVPFLVFMFSFIQTFNLGDHIYSRISGWLNERIEQVVDVVKVGEKKAEDEVAAAEEALAAGELSPELAAIAEGSPPADSEVAGETGRAEEVTGAETPPDAAPDGAEAPEDADDQLAHDILRTIFPTVASDGSEGDLADPVDFVVRLMEDKAMDVRTLGITGLMYVLITVLGLMRNVEWSFNQIWGVTKTRNFLRTMSDYFTITLLLPFVAAGMLGITAALTANDSLGIFSVLLRFSQVVIISLTFALLYYVVPNTSVRLRCALIGGLVAGIMWTLTAWAYVNFNVGLARYTFFFSAFALFPMLLVWIYTSWLILLFGALVSFAYQNEKTFALERMAGTASFAYREAVAVRVMVEMVRRFGQSEAAFSISELAEAWNVPSRLIQEAIEILVAAKLVTVCATEPITYQPARSADRILIRDVVKALREDGEDPSELRDESAYRELYERLGRPDISCLDATVAEFVREEA